MCKLLVVVPLAVFVCLALVLHSGLLGGGGDAWDSIASPYSFSITRWEFENVFDKWGYRVAQVFHADTLSEAEKIQTVRDYLALNQQIHPLESALTREKAEGSGAAEDIASQETRLAALKTERSRLENQVEEIVERQIGAVLVEEGLSITLIQGTETRLLFPPPDFEFDERLKLLIVSARHRIETIDTVLIKPDVSLEEMQEIEEQVEALGFSALVEPIGGVATYPSAIPQMTSIESLLSTTAHEWFHHYLFFRPLGQQYWSNYEMRTINETVADIAGDEVGRIVYQRHYGGDSGEQVETPVEESEPAFDFNKEMREIRLAVDQYLVDGRIDEAERYMEEKRLFLARNGYYIRKLNQAYFAFHGTYADSPTSVSPIGGQVRKLREQSPSLEDFIEAVSEVTSYEELLEVVGE
ncbi:MAG: hypothetical protein SVO26_00500 [Chloroflexota bacterium]|nr:hypothetical protein [Chloroflexota bacterium]